MIVIENPYVKTNIKDLTKAEVIFELIACMGLTPEYIEFGDPVKLANNLYNNLLKSGVIKEER